MDSFPLLAALFLITAATWLISFWRRKSLPPGPTPLPIIGNILQVGSQPHEAFAELSKQYGSLMSIHLGSLYTVVVSSPEMAKEILLKHGQVFSGRTTVEALAACGHNKYSIGLMPVGDDWRDMRKICKEQMFSSQCLERSQQLRRQNLQQLLGHVQKCAEDGRAININEAAFITTLNLMSATLFSIKATEFDSSTTMEFKEIMEGVASIASVPNLADFFPILRPFDLQGVKRLAEVNIGRLLRLIEGYINERISVRRENPNAPKKDDFLDVIVDSLQAKDNKLTPKHFNHLLLELLVGGAETNMTVIEWIMQELVSHPDKIAKVKAELKSVMGDEKVLDESKISKLPYLQAVVKESLRLHPPAAMLVPRKAESDQVVNGYLIPKGTQVLVNEWGMGRDPKIWKNPLSFEPERFLDQKIDFKGQDFELIPFGSGRRVCPGMPLANRILHTVPATLVHNYDWKLERPNASDDEAKGVFLGFSVRRAVPLKIIPYKKA
ncbi:ferruginol synthase 1-like [Salvia hispanica]|uniref:ferruginol synthase 1-like n=1 Tax=Salvia hispanica TaxID=49212 RepID=UPI002009B105|nr:ferruginol synthase 1-like [Salvia hispanica]